MYARTTGGIEANKSGDSGSMSQRLYRHANYLDNP